MPRKPKVVEPNEKVEEFVSRAEDKSSSDSELEIVVKKRPVCAPVKAKRTRKVKTPTPLSSPVVAPEPKENPELLSLQQQLAEMKTQLEQAKNETLSTKKENIAIRRNELDARREMMKIRFN